MNRYAEMLDHAAGALDAIVIIERALWPGVDNNSGRAYDAAKSAHDNLAILVGELTALKSLGNWDPLSPPEIEPEVPDDQR